jgi:L-fuconate dehydratase
MPRRAAGFGRRGDTLKITSLQAFDVRFPTSRQLDGSDAMNADPDYSAAYVVLQTDSGADLAGYGFVFTIGVGNDVQCAAIQLLEPLVVGRDVDEVCGNLGAFARSLTGHSHRSRLLCAVAPTVCE